MNKDLIGIHGLTTKSSAASKNVTTEVNIPWEDKYIYRIHESLEEIHIFKTCL